MWPLALTSPQRRLMDAVHCAGACRTTRAGGSRRTGIEVLVTADARLAAARTARRMTTPRLFLRRGSRILGATPYPAIAQNQRGTRSGLALASPNIAFAGLVAATAGGAQVVVRRWRCGTSGTSYPRPERTRRRTCWYRRLRSASPGRRMPLPGTTPPAGENISQRCRLTGAIRAWYCYPGWRYGST